MLASFETGRAVARLQASFPEEGRMVLEGPFDGQEVRRALREVEMPRKEYLLRARGFRWAQEGPFNR